MVSQAEWAWKTAEIKLRDGDVRDWRGVNHMRYDIFGESAKPVVRTPPTKTQRS